jgi:hypothetical protein
MFAGLLVLVFLLSLVVGWNVDSFFCVFLVVCSVNMRRIGLCWSSANNSAGYLQHVFVATSCMMSW